MLFVPPAKSFPAVAPVPGRVVANGGARTPRGAAAPVRSVGTTPLAPWGAGR